MNLVRPTKNQFFYQKDNNMLIIFVKQVYTLAKILNSDKI